MSASLGFGVRLQQRVARHHHAGRAEAALQAVLLAEALLHRIELAVLLEPLDRHDLAAVGLHREHRAGLDRACRRAAPCTRRSASCRSRCACRSAAASRAGSGRAAAATRPRASCACAVDRDLDLVHRHGSCSLRPRERPAQRARREHARHLLLVLDRAAPVGARVGRLRGEPRRLRRSPRRRASCPGGTSRRPSAGSASARRWSGRCRPARPSPPAPSVSCTATAAVAKSPTLRSSLT